MNIDPDTKVWSLIVAMPSSAALLRRLGVTGEGHDERTLRQACAEAGIDLQQLLRNLDTIDWRGESQTPQQA